MAAPRIKVISSILFYTLFKTYFTLEMELKQCNTLCDNPKILEH